MSASPRSSPPSSPSHRCSPNHLSSPPTSYVCPSPPPPPAPLPWTWTCHCCGQRYNIAVTRRCLSCGHHFCLWHVRRYGGAHVAVHDVRVCGIEFDYVGWRAWMEWRREAGHFQKHDAAGGRGMVHAFERMDTNNGLSEELGGGKARASSRRRRRSHDCSIDCDYPSQCLHGRYIALRECAVAGKGREEASRVQEQEGCAGHGGIPSWP